MPNGNGNRIHITFREIYTKYDRELITVSTNKTIFTIEQAIRSVASLQ